MSENRVIDFVRVGYQNLVKNLDDLRELKNTLERGEEARRLAIVITEIEKLAAIYKAFLLDEQQN